ncbi:MAG: hypothetical protein QXV69_06855 [Sulfolobaceae archaeon]
MQYLVELVPNKNLEKTKREIDELSMYDGFDIPDSPLGNPNILPIAVGAILRERLGKEKRIIINQRLYDVNELYVHSLAITASSLNLELLFTKGDKPKIGKEVAHLSSEDAVKIAKSYGVRAGLILSFRKSLSEIRVRLEFPADFYLALNYSIELLKNIKENRDKIIPYIIIATEKNLQLLESLGQRFFKKEEVMKVIEELETIGIKVVLISSPKSPLHILSKIIKK